MKKLFVILLVTLAVVAFAQQNAAPQNVSAPQKFALVIGNGNYANVTRLSNPVNDANDMEAALKGLGFIVEKVLDGNLEQMENAVLSLMRRLGGTRNTCGFLFYAGHGVQSNGENYLIPVNADNIRNETQLRDRAVSLRFVQDSLNKAGNELNMVVLDACRDSPFEWAPGVSSCLTVVNRAPAGRIVMYVIGANSAAADGTGLPGQADRNGFFTGRFLTHLKTPDPDVLEAFEKTTGVVLRVAGGTQRLDLSLISAGARSFPAPQPAPTAAAIFERGVVFFNWNDYDPAIQEFNEAVGIDPNFAEAYAWRARAYYAKNSYDQALADANQAIQINPQLALAYYARGLAYYGKRDYDRVIADYTEAIRIDPNLAEACYARGLAYQDKNDYDHAVADYTEAIRIDPNLANAYYNRGLVYQDKRDYNRAVADYTEVIRINPHDTGAYNNRGNAYQLKRDYDRAVADYTEAIRLDPNFAGAYNNRGLAYRAKRDTTRANADFAKARELGHR